MILFFRRKRGAKRIEKRTDKRADPVDVAPPVRFPLPFLDEDFFGMTITELSELEARALCERDDIPIFWRDPERD